MYKLKLLDCPHCGGEARETVRCGGGWGHIVYCKDCGSRIEKWAASPSGAKKKAINAWNTRKKLKFCAEWVHLGENVFSVRCSNCNQEFDRVHGFEYKTVHFPNYCCNCGVALVD